MDFTKMSVDEIIDFLFTQSKNGYVFSTTDLSNALDACSVVDPCAGSNALTIFYSGGEDQIINTIARAYLKTPTSCTISIALSKTKIPKQYRENRAIPEQNITPNIENSQPPWYN